MFLSDFLATIGAVGEAARGGFASVLYPASRVPPNQDCRLHIAPPQEYGTVALAQAPTAAPNIGPPSPH
jgi:hypothetical protein